MNAAVIRKLDGMSTSATAYKMDLLQDIIDFRINSVPHVYQTPLTL